MSAVNSSTLAVSSTLASAFSNRSLAFCETSAPPVQIRNSLAHSPPLQIVLGSTFLGPVDPKILNAVDGRLRSPQHTSHRAIRLVIELRGVPIQTVFDALPFLVTFEVRLQRPVEVGRDLSRLVHLPAEVTHRPERITSAYLPSRSASP